jgi:vacuolar-type H+-ATPase subunit H
MREVIQKVLEAENEAKRIVERANAERDQILSDAQKQAKELKARIRKETQVQAERLVHMAVQEAEKKKQALLVQLAAEIETQFQLDEATVQRVVPASVRCVCGP